MTLLGTNNLTVKNKNVLQIQKRADTDVEDIP